MNKKSVNVVFDKVVYSLFSIYFITDYLLTVLSVQNIFIPLLFLIVGVTSFSMYILDKRSFSINKFLMIFMFIFGYLAPLKQYQQNSNLWNLCYFDDSTYIAAIVVEMLFLFSYILCYNMVFKKVKTRKIVLGNVRFSDNVVIKNGSIIFFILTNILCLIYLISTKQLISLDGMYSQSGSDTITLFLMVVVRFFPVATLIYLHIMDRDKRVVARKNLKIIGYLVASIESIIIFFPINGVLPRYFLFSVYIMVAYLFLYKTKFRSLLMLGMVFGFVFLFPAFNFFKYHGINDLSSFAFGGLNFNSNDYDAFQVLMISMNYVKNNGILWGKNIFTALFCFIPRSIWTTKMNASGAVVSSSLNASFTNISCPIYSEFYLAFGYTGVVIFTIFLTYFIRSFEKKIEKMDTISQVINVIIMGMTIYLARGALLPSVSYTLGMILAFLLLYFASKILGGLKI